MECEGPYRVLIPHTLLYNFLYIFPGAGRIVFVQNGAKICPAPGAPATQDTQSYHPAAPPAPEPPVEPPDVSWPCCRKYQLLHRPRKHLR